jgi:predicted DCC family thiol-disulfide oxidoreductase YuxK
LLSTSDTSGAILAFDGVCTLCNALVRFIYANDPGGRVRFVTLQSPRAASLVGAASAGAADTIVLLAGGRRYERSDALLHLLLELQPPWPLGFAAILVPRPLRDAAYRWVARNRYAWFGRRATCPLPPPGLRERFLDDPIERERA